MNILIFVLIFILGTIIGSFLNVVIYRLNTGRTMVRGSSMCMSCGHKLRWFELIPILSFLVQKGKCRTCASRVSFQYPTIEIITGLLFVIIAIKFIPILYFSVWLYVVFFTLFLAIFSILVIIFVYDLRHKIIPDKLSYSFSALSLLVLIISLLLFGSSLVWANVLNIFAGPILALPFVLIWFFSKGRLMGLGDGKLILGIGWLLGLSSGVFSLVFSFGLGAIVGLILVLLSKNKKMNMKTELPFAPFLIIGVLVTFVFNFDFNTLIRLFTF